MAMTTFLRWLLLATIATVLADRVGLGAEPNYTAMCRIHNGNSAGTGCLVGVDERSGLVVTCHHIFTDGVQSPFVVFPNGQRFPAQLVGDDPTNDVSALSIERPNVVPVPLADYQPPKGEQLISAGFGGTDSNRLASNRGTVDRHADLDGSYGAIRLTGTVRSGDSGGPIFNQHGELVAIIWGGNNEGVYGTGSHKVNVMLTQCRGQSCQPYRLNGRYVQQAPPIAPAKPQTNLTPVTPPPAQPQPTKPCNCDPGSACKCGEKYEPRIVKIDGRLLQIEEALANGTLKGEKGDPGKDGLPGKQGERGERGPVGADGKPAPVDEAAVLAILKKYPVYITVVDTNGDERDLAVRIGPVNDKGEFDRARIKLFDVQPGKRVAGSK
jgi:hypothetical protein